MKILKKKRCFVLRNGDAYTVARNPDEKYWGDWSIVLGPTSKKHAYERMRMEKSAVIRKQELLKDISA